MGTSHPGRSFLLGVAIHVVIAATWGFALVDPAVGDTLLLLELLTFIGTLALAPIGLWFRATRRAAVRASCLVAGLAVALFPAAQLSRLARSFTFDALARRSAPLVEAIRRYEAEVGSPPPDLESLVPRYLPRVPGTGLPAHARYEFEPGGCWGRSLRYDLGAGTDSEAHATFEALIDHRGEEALFLLVDPSLEFTVRQVDDDLPDQQPFDAALWARGGRARRSMIADVARRLAGEPSVLEAARRLLGVPDSDERLLPRWELTVFCGRAFQWDRFVYWPEESYPESVHGGTVERIGGWAYVHE